MFDLTIRCQCTAPATLTLAGKPSCRSCAIAAIDTAAPVSSLAKRAEALDAEVLTAVRTGGTFRGTCARVRAPRVWVSEALQRLRAAGLVARDERTYRYVATPQALNAF